MARAEPHVRMLECDQGLLRRSRARLCGLVALGRAIDRSRPRWCIAGRARFCRDDAAMFELEVARDHRRQVIRDVRRAYECALGSSELEHRGELEARGRVEAAGWLVEQ